MYLRGWPGEQTPYIDPRWRGPNEPQRTSPLRSISQQTLTSENTSGERTTLNGRRLRGLPRVGTAIFASPGPIRTVPNVSFSSVKFPMTTWLLGIYIDSEMIFEAGTRRSGHSGEWFVAGGCLLSKSLHRADTPRNLLQICLFFPSDLCKSIIYRHDKRGNVPERSHLTRSEDY